MDAEQKQRVVVGTALIMLTLVASWFMTGSVHPKLVEDVPGPDSLVQHAETHKTPVVQKVTDGIYSAINFAIANSIMVEAPDGVIIVDTTESMTSAAEILTEFRKITEKPIKAIIYTHFHTDHINGAEIFVEDKTNPPEIWSHHTLPQQTKKFIKGVPAYYPRSNRQFGPLLPDTLGSGIGKGLRDGYTVQGYVQPNKFLMVDVLQMEIAGLQIELLHIPGETADQIGVWIPSKRAFLCADDLYRTFPNLYAIRGVPARDVLEWVESLDRMRKLRPQYLIPSHTEPIVGESEIDTLLIQYRDAIQLVHDQTVRYMNKGLHPDEISKMIQFPPQFRDNPYLKEHYGTIEWSSKSVFDAYMGWFSGDPVDLHPLSPKERSQHMSDLVGGASVLLSKAKDALQNEQWQWALELATHVYRLDPSHQDAVDIRTQSMRKLAELETSPNGRNYYLTSILEDHNVINNKFTEEFKNARIPRLSITDIFANMPTRLKAEDCQGVSMTVVYNFTDTEDVISLELRNGILEVHFDEYPEKYDISVTTTTELYKQLITGERSALFAYISGGLQVEGGLLNLKAFMDYIERKV